MGTMSGGSIAKRPPSPSVCEGGNSSRRASVSSGSSRTAGLVVWGCALATAQKRSVACRRKTGRSICQMRAAPISAAAAAAKTRIMFFLPPRCPLQQRVPRKAGRMLPWSLVAIDGAQLVDHCRRRRPISGLACYRACGCALRDVQTASCTTINDMRHLFLTWVPDSYVTDAAARVVWALRWRGLGLVRRWRTLLVA
jgi:hypothetical protein